MMKIFQTLTVLILGTIWHNGYTTTLSSAQVALPESAKRVMLKPNECGSAVYGGNQLLWFCAYEQESLPSEDNSLRKEITNQQNANLQLLRENRNLQTQIAAVNHELEKLKLELTNIETKYQAYTPPQTSDTDNDGVDDTYDLCNNSNANQSVNTIGCDPDQEILLDGVSFSFNSIKLTKESKQTLDIVSDKLKNHPGLNFEIAGHTDNSGNARSNSWISKQRATVVKDYLVSKGIDELRFIVRGYGADKPLSTNQTRKGRSLNRRVSLLLQ